MDDVYQQVSESAEFARWLEAPSSDGPERAIACAELLVHAFPDNPKAWLCLGCSRYGCEDDDGALAAWERAVELAEAVRARRPRRPKWDGIATERAFHRARSQIAFTLEEAPVFQISLEGIGKIRVDRGEVEAARKAFEQYASLYAHRPDGWHYLLPLYEDARDLRGLVRCHRALIASGGEPVANHWNGLARALLDAGRARAAAAVCREALRRDAGDGKTRLLLARALAGLATAAERTLDVQTGGQMEFPFILAMFHHEALRYCRVALLCGDVAADEVLDLQNEVGRRVEAVE